MKSDPHASDLKHQISELEAENSELFKCLKDIIAACDRCVQSDDVSLIDEFTDEMEQDARKAILRYEAKRQMSAPSHEPDITPVAKRSKKPTHDIFGEPIVYLPKCKHCGKEKGQHQSGTFACVDGGTRSFPSFGKQTYEPKAVRAKK